MVQELKGLDFPAEDFKAIGYETAAVIQKTYNGVATLSKNPNAVSGCGCGTSFAV